MNPELEAPMFSVIKLQAAAADPLRALSGCESATALCCEGLTAADSTPAGPPSAGGGVGTD